MLDLNFLTCLVGSSAATAIVFVIGHLWTVRQKNKRTALLRASWRSLSIGEKHRLLASEAFSKGLLSKAKPFSRTLGIYAEAFSTEAGDGDCDRIFESYVSELRRSSPGATTAEWEEALSEITRWVSKSRRPGGGSAR